MRRKNPEKWTAQQERMAVLLAGGKTHLAAAAEVGVSDRTVRLWMADVAYRAYVASLRDQVLAETIGRLTGASTRAVEVLAELLDSDQDAIRIRAATAILDSLIRTREHAELAARVAAVEASLAGDHEFDRRRA